MEAGARRRSREASITNNSSSAGDSTLNKMIPERNASAISSRVLPTPEKTTRFVGLLPASTARARLPDTMSNPLPNRASNRSKLKFELAFTA